MLAPELELTPGTKTMIPAPHTYLPPCPDCGPKNTERDEWACAECNAAVPVCENCRTFIKGCPCGHCETGAHAIEEGAD